MRKIATYRFHVDRSNIAQKFECHLWRIAMATMSATSGTNERFQVLTRFNRAFGQTAVLQFFRRNVPICDSQEALGSPALE